jgi:hypothetical protein
MSKDARHRRALRRAVELPCELVSRYVDEPLLYWATDLTPFGTWLETPFPMELGEQVVLCLKPGIWWDARELMLFAEVTRVSSAKHPEDRGMGLEFLDATIHEQRALAGWLRNRPPPLPRRRARSAEQDRVLPAPACLGSVAA